MSEEKPDYSNYEVIPCRHQIQMDVFLAVRKIEEITGVDHLKIYKFLESEGAKDKFVV